MYSYASLHNGSPTRETPSGLLEPVKEQRNCLAKSFDSVKQLQPSVRLLLISSKRPTVGYIQGVTFSAKTPRSQEIVGADSSPASRYTKDMDLYKLAWQCCLGLRVPGYAHTTI